MLDMTSERVRTRLQELVFSAWNAAQRSPDPSTQLGAVLINEMYFSERPDAVTGQWEVVGYNHFAPNVPAEYWQDKEQKYKHVIHAEEAVLLHAAKKGLRTEGSIMVCGWACCFECAKRMVEAGVASLVIDEEAMERSPERWRESIRLGHEYLTRHGVEIIPLRCSHKTYHKPMTRFNGEDW